MSDVDPSSSSTDRQRKRTVISHSYPDLQLLANRNNPQSDDTNEIDNLQVSPSSEDDTVFLDETQTNGPVDQVVNNLHDNDHDLDVNENTNKEMAKVPEESKIPDIVYDETKPKRLSNAKSLKLDVSRATPDTLHESIVFLISPDEPDSDVSPSRRRRKPMPSVRSEPVISSTGTEASEVNGIERQVSSPQIKPPRDVSPEIIQIQNDNTKKDRGINSSNCVTSAKGADVADSPSIGRIKKGQQYERSPELTRRKVSSPVQRLIVKTGAAAAASNSKSRKSSSEARLDASSLTAPQVVNPQRRRKISSDARLEHGTNTDRMVLPVETTRKRKVSFDPSALINGTRVGPLNDEFRIIKKQPEHIAEEITSPDQGYDDNEIEINVRKISDNTVPEVVVTRTDSDISISDDKCIDGMEESSSGYSEEGDDEDSYGCDNKGYEPCDEDENIINYSSQSNIDNSEPAIIPHTVSPVNHKISSTSLPANIGRGKISTELTPPKSILKIRPEDAQSIASEDSVQAKSFKVRKDSIALFMDQHGTVGVEEIKKDSRGVRCFDKNDIKQLWSNRNFLLEKYKLHLLVLTLFLLTFAFVVIGLHFHSEHRQYVAASQKVFFDAKPRILSLSDITNQDTLRGTIGLGIPSWKMPTHCYQNYKNIMDKTCLKWKSHGQLDIAYFLQNNTQCYNITWNLLPGTSAFDCYHIGTGYWYGPLNMTRSQWPITSKQFTFTVSKSKHHGSGTFSSAVEYYWLSSRGEAVVVDSNYPLEISWNTKRRGAFCVIGKAPGDFYNDVEDAPLKTFQYTVCNGIDIQSTHSLIRKRFYPTLTSMPDKTLLESPHWSTVSDSDNFDLNQTLVESVAESLYKHKLDCSAVEIDGKWEKRFGDLNFNTNSFSNMSGVIAKITKAGCDLSLNIYPFFGVHSVNFPEGLQKGYFVRDVGGTVPALLKWEHGVGAMLDVSNPAARDWFATKVRHLASEYDIQTFRLVYGSSSWFPHSPVFHIDNISPSKVKLMFADLMASLGNVVVESTSQSQHISSLVGVSSSIIPVVDILCLRNIIPDVLNLGLMGYPFVLSDGFITEETHDGGDFILPSRDLFIRWMQLSVFFPAIRYTVKPWLYDTEVIELSKNLTKFHNDVVLDVIEKSRDQIFNGAPIIRPMWWNHSKDKNTFRIDDQFFLADSYLVAPILCERNSDNDVTKRDVYIPEGVWSDMSNKKVIIGPRLVRDYNVDQFHIPVFRRLSQYEDE
ncbi:hypothetical protein ACF0H5_013879 [Mactra antiquata]